MKIYQLTENNDKNSSILNTIYAFDECYKQLGYDTEIIKGLIEDPFTLNEKLEEDDILIYHFYYLYDENVKFLKCKKVLMFQNVTDPDCLPGLENVKYRNDCKAGLYDTYKTYKHFDCAIVPSEYSRKMLIEAGWDKNKIFLIPLIIRNDKLKIEPDYELIKQESQSVNIVFTGRIVPSKKQEDVIRIFEYYHNNINKNSKLFIVGNKSSNCYSQYLEYLIEKTGLGDSVCITGRVPMKEYVTYYHIANIFLCMSEHEGFCIPLVEAMYFDVPIIALRKTAVGDTLGNAGVQFDDVEIKVIANEIDRIIKDKDYKDKIIEIQKERLIELDSNSLFDEHKKMISYVENNINKTCFSIKNASTYELWNLKNEKCITYKLDEHKDLNIIVYGAGDSGIDLYSLFKDRITSFVDAYKGGMGITHCGKNVLSLAELRDEYRDELIIIAVQKTSLWIELVATFIALGIDFKKIYIFNRDDMVIF